jgi:hypothetical protein
MENTEKSEVVIAKILEKIMEFGLQNADLEYSELELDESYRPFFTTCCDWLIDEGLIRTVKHVKFLNNTSELYGVVLTSYGFAVLGQKIAGLDKEIAVSEAVKQVADNKAGLSQYGDFFGGLLGGFTKSLGS